MVDVETDALLDVRVNVEEVVLEVVPMDARAVEVVVPDANRVVRILVLPHVETGAEITALVDVRVLAHPVVLVIVNLVVLETVPVDAQELVQDLVESLVHLTVMLDVPDLVPLHVHLRVLETVLDSVMVHVCIVR